MSIQNNKTTILLLFLISLIINGCDTTGPGKETGLTVSAEDVSCTEVWLRLQSGGAVTNPVTITANDKPVKEVNLVSPDTVIYIDSLLPGQQYKLKAAAKEASSNEAAVKTLDTTSHDFVWETYQFGSHGSSLYDVAIISENDIWAVGEIYINDETNMYNAVHWDGEKWELKRIPVRDDWYSYYYTQLRSVYAFSANDVWFAGYADLIQWNGSNFQSKALFMETAPFDGQVNQIWGTDSKNIYCAGNGGALYHYTGQSWKKIETGTKTIIDDIWGIRKAEGEIVYCTISSFFEPGDKKIIKISNGKIDSVNWNVERYLSGIWTNTPLFLYVCGDGVFENKRGNWQEIPLPAISTNEIRGTGLNDIMVVGDMGLVAHYNGIAWKTYGNIYNAAYYSISMLNNTAVIAGARDGKGIITIGKKN